MAMETTNDVLLTKEQWQTFEDTGYLRLGKVLSEQELTEISNRINSIMLGTAKLDYNQIMMQREAGEGFEQSDQTLGFKGATLNYRKIENLEHDPLFLAYMQNPLFRHICEQIYGANTSISCYRAMFMNKPAHHGSVLAYHQDRWNHLDRDPKVTVWTALDPATKENGCVKVFPSTHRNLLNPDNHSGFLTSEQADRLTENMSPVYLELEAGEAVLLHNWTVHGSEGNVSDQSRRAFSVCYMDSNTVSNAGIKFPIVFQK